MLELTPHGIAHGGEAVARHGGKTWFVAGAIPGELVRAEPLAEKRKWGRAQLVGVVEPAADRIEPPCPYFAECGGCQWQFAEHRRQLIWKQEVVAGQLRHLGRLADPPVREALAPGPAFGYRNRVDFDVTGGRTAFHQSRSDALVPIDRCLLLEPGLAALHSRLGDLTGVDRVTLRASDRTGDALVVVTGSVPDQAEAWGAAVGVLRHRAVQPAIGTPVVHEVVAGCRFRITGTAFFQVNTAGAEILVDLVGRALDPQPGETLLDAYAGVGLFGATVGRAAAEVIAVEVDPFAVADLQHNLAGTGIRARVVHGRVEEVVPALDVPWQVVVCDPSRRGLRARGVAAITAGRPRAIAYVSCDAASLARDTRLLGEAGYLLDWAQPVDLFPQTFHVETVAAFRHR